MPLYSAGGPQMGGSNVDGIRDAITQALMNVQNPQPRTQVPPGMGGGLGAPQMSGGIPPAGGQGMPPGTDATAPPAPAMPPGAPPAVGGQVPPPMPGGAPLPPGPPRGSALGQQMPQQIPGTQLPMGPGQLGPY